MKTRLLLPILAAGLLLASASQAGEVLVANDSTTNGVPSTSFPNFLVGESTAAWLTAPCDGKITAVQVYWASQVGGAAPSFEDSISLFTPGTFPSAGPVMLDHNGASAIVVAPTLLDSVMNEFRHLDPPTNSVSLRVPVQAGQSFVASLKFFNQSSGGNIFTPAPTADQDGCQASTNAVDVIPGGWVDACAAGVTGDWVIRAKVECNFVPSVPSASPSSMAVLLVLLAVTGSSVFISHRGRRHSS